MSVGQVSAPDPGVPTQRKIAGLKPVSESRIERNGLKPGSVAPEFTLPDIYGRSISLEQYRGQRVLLVFSDPHCGPCSQISPYLARVYRKRRKVTTEIVVISRGSIEENRQKAEAHGFEFPVVLQDRWKLSKKYGIFATPVAFLIGEDGRTEREVAVGLEQIRNLLQKEFIRGPVDRTIEGLDEISTVLSNRLSRRQAFRVAASIAAGTLFSMIGMHRTAAALSCGTGFIICGTGCCSTSLVCCNGKCCAAGQSCVLGQCQQQILP
jgi:peroxiredoxin